MTPPEYDFSTFVRFKLPPFECGPGWRPLIHETLSKIAAIVGDVDGIEIDQIKEKYARLVIYFSARGTASCFDTQIENVIRDAERRSAKICDQCGKPGKEFETGLEYLMTRCDEHAPPRQKATQ